MTASAGAASLATQASMTCASAIQRHPRLPPRRSLAPRPPRSHAAACPPGAMTRSPQRAAPRRASGSRRREASAAAPRRRHRHRRRRRWRASASIPAAGPTPTREAPPGPRRAATACPRAPSPPGARPSARRPLLVSLSPSAPHQGSPAGPYRATAGSLSPSLSLARAPLPCLLPLLLHRAAPARARSAPARSCARDRDLVWVQKTLNITAAPARLNLITSHFQHPFHRPCHAPLVVPRQARLARSGRLLRSFLAANGSPPIFLFFFRNGKTKRKDQENDLRATRCGARRALRRRRLNHLQGLFFSGWGGRRGAAALPVAGRGGTRRARRDSLPPPFPPSVAQRGGYGTRRCRRRRASRRDGRAACVCAWRGHRDGRGGRRGTACGSLRGR